jgi:hypothetical protein
MPSRKWSYAVIIFSSVSVLRKRSKAARRRAMSHRPAGHKRKYELQQHPHVRFPGSIARHVDIHRQRTGSGGSAGYRTPDYAADASAPEQLQIVLPNRKVDQFACRYAIDFCGEVALTVIATAWSHRVAKSARAERKLPRSNLLRAYGEREDQGRSPDSNMTSKRHLRRLA